MDKKRQSEAKRKISAELLRSNRPGDSVVIVSRSTLHPRACGARGLDITPRSRTLITVAGAVLLAAFAPLVGSPDLLAQEDVFESRSAGFGEGWKERWEDFGLGRERTSYEVVEEGSAPVLMARSERSASALLHRLRLAPAPRGLISWRWKIEGTIKRNRRERSKAGDDYAARLFVIFDAEPFTREARALCYVWASSEPVGAMYENPYHSQVVTIVLDTGDERAGEWIPRERDFMNDFREAFGREPEFVSGIALMVDTDDTGSQARSWFDQVDIRLLSEKVNGLSER